MVEGVAPEYFSEPDEKTADTTKITLTEMGVSLIEPTQSEKSNFSEIDSEEAEESVLDSVTDSSPAAKLLYNSWMEDIFNAETEPRSLFSSETKQVADGKTVEVVDKAEFGEDNRPVLQWSDDFQSQIKEATKYVSLQYALTSGHTPQEVTSQIPYDLFPSEIRRVRNFVESCGGFCWVSGADTPSQNRAPIGFEDNSLTGILYVMYSLRKDEARFDYKGKSVTKEYAQIVPRYIGITERTGRDDMSLSWNIKKTSSKSVFCRWGYGQGQHLGELSAALWPDSHNFDPEPKYKRWADSLFLQDRRVLNEPVYASVFPWWTADVQQSERNLVRLAQQVFGDAVLNVEYTHDIPDQEQQTLTGD